jgi:hypothetical protein
MNREAIMNSCPAPTLTRHQCQMAQENGLQCATHFRSNTGSGAGVYFASGSWLLMVRSSARKWAK